MSFSYFAIDIIKKIRHCISNDVYVLSSLKLLDDNFCYDFKIFFAEVFENSLKFDVTNPPNNLLLELIDLLANKNHFYENNLTLFYSSLPKNKFPNLRNFAKSLICIFENAYICKHFQK